MPEQEKIVVLVPVDTKKASNTTVINKGRKDNTAMLSPRHKCNCFTQPSPLIPVSCIVQCKSIITCIVHAANEVG